MTSVCYISLIQNQNALTGPALVDSHSVVNPITFADDVLRRMTSLTVLESEMNLSSERPAAVPLKASVCLHITADEFEKQNTQKQKREKYLPDCCAAGSQGCTVARALWRGEGGYCAHYQISLSAFLFNERNILLLTSSWVNQYSAK